MKCNSCERCPMASLLRWAGRLISLAVCALVAWFLIAHIIAGEGPNPWRMSGSELGLSTTMLVALVGMLIGWRWERVGGLLVIGSMMLFFVIERLAVGAWPRGWAIWTLAVPGVLYLLASGFEACRTRHLRAVV